MSSFKSDSTDNELRRDVSGHHNISLLVVLDEAVLDHQEDGLKLIWIFDIREPKNPVSISTCSTPSVG